MKGPVRIILPLLLLLAGPWPLRAEVQNRTALVIGNAGYRHQDPLTNTLNDAEDLATDLKTAGFDVSLVKDANQDKLIAAVEAFATRLRERGGAGLLYYSGHGVQVDGRNYLVPVDAALETKGKIKYEAYALDDILDHMGGRGPGAVNLVILDACRNNPFSEAKGGKGLARVEAPESTLILYAAKPGQTASDNPQGRNGLFTQHLRQALKRPGQDVDAGFSEVVKAVYAASAQKQYPWKEGVLLAPFQFIPGQGGGEIERQRRENEALKLVLIRERERIDVERQRLAAEAAAQAQTKPQPSKPEPRPEPPPQPPPAEGKSYRDPVTGMEFVKIEGGSFQMGSPPGEKDRQSNEKQHRVSVGAFYLGKHEVTNAQYRKFKPGHYSGEFVGKSLNGDDQPVVSVSWEEATAYAEWLSKETGKHYRLPTEAEWEYAARAGTTTAYSWGNEVGMNRANCDGCGSRWDIEQTAPVGSFPASPWGLHDMHGNVCEWTADCWRNYQGAPTESRAWAKGGDCARRVLRGGSWAYGPQRLRSADRSRYVAVYRNYITGFRVARTLTP